MANNSISIAIQLEGKDALNTIKGLEKGFDDLAKNTTQNVKKMDGAIASFAGNLAAMGTVKVFDFIKESLIGSLDAFVAFEDGMVAVAKTTNFTDKEVKQFTKNIEKMAKEIPATTEELLGIAEAAGQLGVTGVKKVTKFTETIAKLGRVSNLEGAEAATTLTRILTVTGEGVENIDTFASVIVALGNNFAATEAEIANMTNEITRAGAQFGITSADAAALSAALRASGVRAEEAGGVMTKAFVQINEAIQKGGKGFKLLEQATGKTGAALKKAFKDDAAGVFRDFIAGIEKAGNSSLTMSDKLNILNIKGIRVSKLIPTLAKNIGEYDRAINIANGELENANALNDEYAQILDNTSTKIDLFKNAVSQLSKEFFSNLAPAFNNVVDVTTAFLERLSADGPLQKAQANAKGLSATIKDVGYTTSFVNGLLADFLVNVNQSFADDRVKRMNEELKVTEATVASLSKESTGLQKIEADIILAEDALKKLNAEIADESISEKLFGKSDEDTKAEQAQLAELTTKLAELRAERLKEIDSIKKVEEAAVAAAEKKKEIAAKELEDAKLAQVEKQTFEEEIRAAETDRLATQREERKLAKELEANEDFEFLSKNLGREQAAKELYAAKNIEDEGKRREALHKINAKANANAAKQREQDVKNAEAAEKQKVQDRRAALQAIVSLTSSGNGALYEIGKAAAVVNAGINTSEAVTKALSSVPYPFNFAAAGVVGVAGAQQIAKIAAAPRPKRSAGDFADGGIIGGNSPTGDNLTANVNSGEVIFNKRQQQNLFNAVDSGNIGGGGPQITINNPVFMNEEMVDQTIDQINDRVEFGNKTLKASEVA